MLVWVRVYRMWSRVLSLIPVFTLFLGCGDAGGSGSDGASSGAQTSSSGETPTTTDASSGSSGASGSGDSSSGGGEDPLLADPVCSSGKMWTQGNTESPYMHPGMACLTCHKQMEPSVANRFLVVGTVFPTGHEPDDCLGLDGPAEEATYVEVTTADATVLKLPVNSSGNFMYDALLQGGAITFPITAKVVKGDRERVMLTPQMSGDCNSCHTQAGTMAAPGRIVAPI